MVGTDARVKYRFDPSGLDKYGGPETCVFDSFVFELLCHSPPVLVMVTGTPCTWTPLMLMVCTA